jgi:cytochrome c oxidase, subunit II
MWISALLPERASDYAVHVDTAFWITFFLSLIFFVIINFAILVFIIKYRRRKGDEEPGAPISHNTPLEIVWTIIPTILIFVIFWFGFKAYAEIKWMREKPKYEIRITARQWGWTAEYSDGKKLITGTIKDDRFITTKDFQPIIFVPAGEPVQLVLTSQDVIHSFYVPEFRVKYDAIPGRYTKIWFQAKKPGEYEVFCTEYCGAWHSRMPAKVLALPPKQFERFLKLPPDKFNNTLANMPIDSIYAVLNLSDEEFEKWSGAQEKLLLAMSPAERGKLISQRLCQSCHSFDGSQGIGPTWKGLFGSERILADGKRVLADENYIRESILQPGEKIVKGFQPVMPSFQGQLSEEQISDIIEFIKSLK